MKISFVIPAFNEEKNIVDCILSIFAEAEHSGKDYEIIVVNNASTDKTRELSLKHGVMVVDENRKGIVWARKAGMEASSGDIIANIDADNRLPKGWLTTVYRLFAENKDAIALSGPLIYYDSSLFVRFWTKLFYVFGYFFDKLLSIFSRSSMLQGGNYIVRSDAMKKIGGFDTSIEFYGEDTDIGKRLSKIGKVVWTFDLPMFSSGRRMQKEGLIVMGIKYATNYVWIVITGKPFTKKYLDVRQ